MPLQLEYWSWHDRRHTAEHAAKVRTSHPLMCKIQSFLPRVRTWAWCGLRAAQEGKIYYIQTSSVHIHINSISSWVTVIYDSIYLSCQCVSVCVWCGLLVLTCVLSTAVVSLCGSMARTWRPTSSHRCWWCCHGNWWCWMRKVCCIHS